MLPGCDAGKHAASTGTHHSRCMRLVLEKEFLQNKMGACKGSIGGQQGIRACCHGRHQLLHTCFHETLSLWNQSRTGPHRGTPTATAKQTLSVYCMQQAEVIRLLKRHVQLHTAKSGAQLARAAVILLETCTPAGSGHEQWACAPSGHVHWWRPGADLQACQDTGMLCCQVLLFQGLPQQLPDHQSHVSSRSDKILHVFLTVKAGMTAVQLSRVHQATSCKPHSQMLSACTCAVMDATLPE